MAIGAPVGFAGAGGVFGENLLAREGRVAPATADGVAANVTVRVPDVVTVFFIEGVIGDKAEGLAPEEKAVVKGEANPFEEESVLQPAEILQMAVFAKCHVQVSHTEGKMGGESVDGGGVDGRAVEDCI